MSVCMCILCKMFLYIPTLIKNKVLLKKVLFPTKSHSPPGTRGPRSRSLH